MKTLPIVVACIAVGLIAQPTNAALGAQPPMNDFNFAFYICDGGASFMMTYDANPPTSASMTTNDDNRTRQLKRAADNTVARFEGDGVTFWTDGKVVRVQGTRKPYPNCKLKAG